VPPCGFASRTVSYARFAERKRTASPTCGRTALRQRAMFPGQPASRDAYVELVTALHATSTVPNTVIEGTLINVQHSLGAGAGWLFTVLLVTVGSYFFRFSGWPFWGKAAIVLAVGGSLVASAVGEVWCYCRYYLQHAHGDYADYGWYFTASVLTPAVGGLLGGYCAAKAGSGDLPDKQDANFIRRRLF
jgi:hypothetical protein